MWTWMQIYYYSNPMPLVVLYNISIGYSHTFMGCWPCSTFGAAKLANNLIWQIKTGESVSDFRSLPSDMCAEPIQKVSRINSMNETQKMDNFNWIVSLFQYGKYFKVNVNRTTWIEHMRKYSFSLNRKPFSLGFVATEKYVSTYKEVQPQRSRREPWNNIQNFDFLFAVHN